MKTIQNDSVSLAIYYMFFFLGKLWQIRHLWRAIIRITVLIVIIIHGLFVVPCSGLKIFGSISVQTGGNVHGH